MTNASQAADKSLNHYVDLVKAQGSENETFFGYPVVEGGLYLQQDPFEFAALTKFLAEEVKSADLTLDLGIASGGQTKFLRDHFEAKETIILDDGKHPLFHHWERIKKEVKSDIVFEMIEDSHKPSVREALKPWYGKVDLAYVDGDHSYKGLRQDIFLMKHLMKDGSLLILHDTTAVWDCRRVFEDLVKSPDFHLYRNFDNRFGISVWIKAGRRRIPKWHSHAFGWGRI